MSETIKVQDAAGHWRSLRAEPGWTLGQVIFLSGHWPAAPLCSGLGRCGRCRVRFKENPPVYVPAETRFFSPEELRQGWRLGCQHQALAGAKVFLPRQESFARVKPRTGAVSRKAGPGLSLAVDLGTTSLHWSAAEKGKVVARGMELNPQLGAGTDVMARLAFASSSLRAEKLKSLVVDRLRAIAADLPGPVTEISLAGNPAMIFLFLGLDISGLPAAPYHLAYTGGTVETLAPDLPGVYVLPLLSPFVGGDVTSGLAAITLGRPKPSYPFVLADMGTNGEFVLAVSPDEYLAASVPLGPALEGTGLTFGAVAEPGAVASFELSPSGLVPKYLGEPVPGTGVTGTGYLSLLARLLSVGLLDVSGRFSSGNTPLAAKLARTMTEVRGEKRLPITKDAYLTALDVEEVLKVKAAFNLALSRLLREAGISENKLCALYLAGALGEHVNVNDMERLGFFPPGFKAKVRVVGNASLTGAGLVLVEDGARAWVQALRPKVRVLDLALDPDFMKSFVGGMAFEYVSTPFRGS
ncbi:MAG: ASKHA domain-containing protein [Thermodesulfobacteriota bacterium]|nr:ASKHA domain-containing protein [Thermodesulfobacteriota bacterium]